jgi:hypothetical protein
MTKWDLAVSLYKKQQDEDLPITFFTREEQELISFYCKYKLAEMQKDVLSKVTVTER